MPNKSDLGLLIKGDLPENKKIHNLKGSIFGELKVEEYVGYICCNKHKRFFWKCRCSCSNEFITSTDSLKGGTYSCGCKKNLAIHMANTKHGFTETREFRIWSNIKRACHDKKYSEYKVYGKRGIKICEEWKDSFVDFLVDMGRSPSKNHVIDLIDYSKDFSFYNCEWMISEQKILNKSVIFTDIKKEEFLLRVKEKHGDKFIIDLTNFIDFTHGKIFVTCPIHGQFDVIPNIFIMNNNEYGCPKCGLDSRTKSKTKDYADFLRYAKSVHGDKYTYPTSNECVYKNRKSVIDVVCPQHGSFKKKAQKHVAGQGCFRCNIDELIENGELPGGYCESLFLENKELADKPGHLYYLSINNGKSYKIGISININQRIGAIKAKAGNFIKDIELVWSVSDNLYNCYKLEQSILEKFKDKRVFFKWSTEIFKENVLPSKPTSRDVSC